MGKNLKINLKILVALAIILGTMLLLGTTKVEASSRAIVTEGEPTENSLNNIPSTISLDIKESECEKVPQLIMNKITEELKKQGITTMPELEYEHDANDKYLVSVWFGSLDDEGTSYDMIVSEEQIYKVNIRVSKGYSTITTTPIINREITINYNNTDQYNEEDRKYVEDAMNKFKEKNPIIYNYIKPHEDYDYEKNLERLLNDPSITFVNTGCGEADPEESWSACGELVFKNGVCYQWVRFEHYTYYTTENVNIGNNITVDGLLENVKITVTPKENVEMIAEANKVGYTKVLGTYELTLIGATSLVNPIDITFDVGTEYNGQMAYILHKKASGSYEKFEEQIQNGKVTITVSELSPFVIAVKETAQEGTETTPITNNEETETTPTINNEEVETTPTTNKGEKDTTPKTATIDIIGYVLVTTILSGVGIVVLKKKF